MATPFDPKVTTRNDWKFLQGREVVSLQSLGPIGSYVAYPLASGAITATVLRRALNWKEIQASAGAYTGVNQNFIVPDAVLPSGILPKAGDLLQDAGGVNHTILEVQIGKHGNTHRCTTIALSVVNNLGVTGTLSRPDNTQDGAGRMALTSYGAVGTSLCRVEPEDSAAADVLGRKTTAKKYTAFLGTPLSVQARDRFTAAGVTYTVLGFHNPARLDQLQSLDLEVVA